MTSLGPGPWTGRLAELVVAREESDTYICTYLDGGFTLPLAIGDRYLALPGNIYLVAFALSPGVFLSLCLRRGQ